jgi:hypothetical protein
MGDVVEFRDPQADLQGDELEAALAVAREYAEAAATGGLSHGMTLLGHAPGCERLGICALLPILAAAVRAELQKVDPQ